MFKAFITNLGKYNEGYLIGEWLSFPCDPSEIQEVLRKIGCDQPGYEEYFITDYEEAGCLFNPSDYFKEFTNLQFLNEIATTLEDIDNAGDLKQFNAYLEASGDNVQFSVDHYTDITCFYEEQTLEDVAYMIVEECYDLPEIAQRYFDYEAFARDLGFDGYIETSYGVICL